MKILKEEEIDKMSLRRLRSYHKTVIAAESMAHSAYYGNNDTWWGFGIDKEEFDRRMLEITPIKNIILRNLHKYHESSLTQPT